MDLDDRGVATIIVDHPPINLITIEVLLRSSPPRSSDWQQPTMPSSVSCSDRRTRSGSSRISTSRRSSSFLEMQPAPTEIGPYDQMCETLRTMPKPTIAIIAGRVGGGGSELALGLRHALRHARRDLQSARGRARHHPGRGRHGPTPTTDRSESRRSRSYWAATTSTPRPPSGGDGSIGSCPTTRSMRSSTDSLGGWRRFRRTPSPQRRRASFGRRSTSRRDLLPRAARSTSRSPTTRHRIACSDSSTPADRRPKVNAASANSPARSRTRQPSETGIDAAARTSA